MLDADGELGVNYCEIYLVVDKNSSLVRMQSVFDYEEKPMVVEKGFVDSSSLPLFTTIRATLCKVQVYNDFVHSHFVCSHVRRKFEPLWMVRKTAINSL